jgi:hypothetical protein
MTNADDPVENLLPEAPERLMEEDAAAERLFVAALAI